MKRNSIDTPRIVPSESKSWLESSITLIAVVLILNLAPLLYSAEQMLDEASIRSTEHLKRVTELQQQINVLTKERDEYRLKAAQYERASQVDQEVVSTVQTDLRALQDERTELRQQVEFYKSLVSGDVTSLQLIDFKIEKSDVKNTYRYMLTVSKRAKGQEKVQGDLVFSITGKQSGKTKKLSSNDLSIQGSRLSMNFQNFQNYKGTFKLPGGFKPRIFKVAVQPNGDKFKNFAKDFPWSLIATE